VLLFFCCSFRTGWCDSVAAFLVPVCFPEPWVESDWPCRRAGAVLPPRERRRSFWTLLKRAGVGVAEYTELLLLPPGTFRYFPVLQFHSFKVTSCFFSSSKFWVSFRDFLAKFYRKPSYRQRARVYCRPGLEIRYKIKLCLYRIMKTRKKRAARFHSQSEAPQAPQVTKKRPRRRFLPLIALRTRVARFFNNDIRGLMPNFFLACTLSHTVCDFASVYRYIFM